MDYDQGRGGYGQLMWQEIEARQQAATGQMDVDSGYGYEQQDYSRQPQPQPPRRRKQQQDYPHETRNPLMREDDE